MRGKPGRRQERRVGTEIAEETEHRVFLNREWQGVGGRELGSSCGVMKGLVLTHSL